MAEEKEARRHRRFALNCPVTVTWEDKAGIAKFAHGRAVDISDSGIRIEVPIWIERYSPVYVRAEQYGILGSARVRHCNGYGSKYIIGLEFDTTQNYSDVVSNDGFSDYYELLQISPCAEQETIHRVYRILAARYHPDNLETGNNELFLRLCEAYKTLSDPKRKAAYDERYRKKRLSPLPVFEMKEFVHGVQGQVHRRLGILYLLYQQRRMNPDRPGLSLLEFESLMALPREHLLFSLWWLKESQYVEVVQNSDYAVTAAGATFLESHISFNPVLHRLLDAPGAEPAAEGSEHVCAWTSEAVAQ